MLRALADRLLDPRVRGVDPDSDDLVEIHRRILADRPMIRGVFDEFYDTCIDLDRQYGRGEGARVEIGAGSSRFKARYPGIICTDIKHAPHLDRVLDAQAMSFDDQSLRAVFGINCFHHLPDPDAFFSELERVLVPGGCCVLIEPHSGIVAARFYRHLFASERFDPAQRSWSDPGLGVMDGANQALSWIVFVRDRDRLEATHEGLEILVIRPLTNYVRYLASGGLNFRPLLPARSAPWLRRIERLLGPAAETLALHRVIVLRRRC